MDEKEEDHPQEAAHQRGVVIATAIHNEHMTKYPYSRVGFFCMRTDMDYGEHEIRCIAIIVNGDDDGFDAMKPWESVLCTVVEMERDFEEYVGVLHAVHSML